MQWIGDILGYLGLVRPGFMTSECDVIGRSGSGTDMNPAWNRCLICNPQEVL